MMRPIYCPPPFPLPERSHRDHDQDSLIHEWESWANKINNNGLIHHEEDRLKAVTTLKLALSSDAQILDLSDLQLTELPNHFPPSLEKLILRNNRLKELPQNLPDNLKEIDLTKNYLSDLPPSLPSSLQILLLSSNWFVTFPFHLPQSLEVLKIDNNFLRYLPNPFPLSLRVMDIRQNLWTNMPFHLSLSVQELISDFSDPTQLHSLRQHQIRSFRNHHNRSDAGDHDTFLRAIHLWNESVDRNQWQAISYEENARNFARFLEDLGQEKNIQNNILKERVSDWLKQLVKPENNALRKLTFAVAAEIQESCVDRSSFYFNKMYLLMVENHLINKPHSSIEQLIKVNREIFRLLILEKIAAAHCERRRRWDPEFSEDIEIYLAYQYKLRRRLSLPIHTEFHFQKMAGVQKKDLLEAEKKVMEEEKKGFLRFLITESNTWKLHLERWNRVETNLISEHYLDEIHSEKFEKEVRNVLKKNNISYQDKEAHHLVSKKMAEDLFFQTRYQLTLKWLTEIQALALIEPYDKPHKTFLMSV